MPKSKSLLWLINFAKDRIIQMAFLFSKSKELQSYKNSKEYSEKFLNDFTHQDKMREIWDTLLQNQLRIQEPELHKIYRLNFTLFFELSLSRVLYYIENHFWSSLDLYEIDTWSRGSEEVFETPSLATYAILKKDGSIIVAVTSLHKQKYNLIKKFKFKRLPLWKFKRRQLVYDAKSGFLSV